MNSLSNPFALCLAMVAAFCVSTAQADHDWNNYHWARTTQGFDLKVIDSVTSDWQSEFDSNLNLWSQSAALNLVVDSTDDSSKSRKRCNSKAGQMRVCNAAYGQNGWLGLASINIDTAGHITQGTAKVNDSYDWYWTGEDKNHVMCQEVGHVFGLGHTTEDGSSQQTCMDYSRDPGSQWPNTHDYNELAAIYAHTDGYDSYATTTDGGGSSGCKGRFCQNRAEIPPMGVRVHQGKNHEIWVSPGQNSSLWIHHIRLVPDGEDSHQH